MSVRCFVAIELPDDVRALFAEACQTIRETDPRWKGDKWVAEANLHVTLKFVGHIAEPSVDALIAACRDEIARVPRFELETGAAVAVPQARKARMLWASFTDPEGACAGLAAACDRAALAVGATHEDRPFKPHVTLVRARNPHPVDAGALSAANALLAASPRTVSVAAATVFSSTLNQGGPTYTALAQCPLGE
jgi:2'-5' RNA ligase